MDNYEWQQVYTMKRAVFNLLSYKTRKDDENKKRIAKLKAAMEDEHFIKFIICNQMQRSE